MSNNDWNTKDTVAGYFASGEDARHAIHELIEEGFKASEIGAAFHSGTRLQASSRGSAQVTAGAPLRSEAASDATFAGVASGTGAVTPSGLSTGGGTGVAGASRPGPIPGGEIPANLPTNIPSDLPSDAETQRFSGAHPPVRQAGETVQNPGDIHDTRENKSWWDSLKDVFRGEGTEDVTASRRTPVSDKGSLNYGTGEGDLGIDRNYYYAYSGSAFEQSFSGMGIPPEHAQRISHELRRGGAVVTVKAGSRNPTAEAVLERNHGIIRYESTLAAEEGAWDSGDQGDRVEIFGEVHRIYPGYVPADTARQRKAS